MFKKKQVAEGERPEGQNVFARIKAGLRDTADRHAEQAANAIRKTELEVALEVLDYRIKSVSVHYNDGKTGCEEDVKKFALESKFSEVKKVAAEYFFDKGGRSSHWRIGYSAEICRSGDAELAKWGVSRALKMKEWGTAGTIAEPYSGNDAKTIEVQAYAREKFGIARMMNLDDAIKSYNAAVKESNNSCYAGDNDEWMHRSDAFYLAKYGSEEMQRKAAEFAFSVDSSFVGSVCGVVDGQIASSMLATAKGAKNKEDLASLAKSGNKAVDRLSVDEFATNKDWEWLYDLKTLKNGIGAYAAQKLLAATPEDVDGLYLKLVGNKRNRTEFAGRDMRWEVWCAYEFMARECGKEVVDRAVSRVANGLIAADDDKRAELNIARQFSDSATDYARNGLFSALADAGEWDIIARLGSEGNRKTAEASIAAADAKDKGDVVKYVRCYSHALDAKSGGASA